MLMQTGLEIASAWDVRGKKAHKTTEPCLCSSTLQQLTTVKMLNAQKCDGPKSSGVQSLAGAIMSVSTTHLHHLSLSIKIFANLLQIISLT